jgi:hypothetical protein
MFSIAMVNLCYANQEITLYNSIIGHISKNIYRTYYQDYYQIAL